MAVPLLSDVAIEQLKKITVKALPIKLWVGAGAAWNVGELGLVYVEITNTTGVPLRDVYVETSLWGTAAQYQQIWTWDGNGGIIGDFEPGETRSTYVSLLKAVSPGWVTIFVKLCAEIVPYACFWPTYRKEQIHPA